MSYCVVLYLLDASRLCRHGVLLLALIQTSHLVEGKVNANHRSPNKFA